MKTLRYFYFRVYSYYENGGIDPFLSTCTTIIVILAFNVLTLMEIASIFISGFKLTLPVLNGKGNLLLIIPLVVIYGVLYFLLKKSGLHYRIIDEFKNESASQRNQSSAGVFLYIIFSIAVFVFSLWLRQKMVGY